MHVNAAANEESSFNIHSSKALTFLPVWTDVQTKSICNVSHIRHLSLHMTNTNAVVIDNV